MRACDGLLSSPAKVESVRHYPIIPRDFVCPERTLLRLFQAKDDDRYPASSYCSHQLFLTPTLLHFLCLRLPQALRSFSNSSSPQWHQHAQLSRADSRLLPSPRVYPIRFQPSTANTSDRALHRSLPAFLSTPAPFSLTSYNVQCTSALRNILTVLPPSVFLLQPREYYVSLPFSTSAFFSRARTAATIGTLLFFVALFPYFAVSDKEGVTANQRRAACLLPSTCLALGTVPLVEFEDAGVVSSFPSGLFVLN